MTALIADVDVLGMSLGNGWYRGRLGFQGQEHLYGDVVVRNETLAPQLIWTSPGGKTLVDFVDVDLPDACRAEVSLPDLSPVTVNGGQHTLTAPLSLVPADGPCLDQLTGRPHMPATPPETATNCLLERRTDCDCSPPPPTRGR